MTSTDRSLSSGSGHVLLVVACRGINDTPRGSRAMLTRRQLALQNAGANLPSAPSLHSHSRAPQHLVLAHFYVLATNSSSRAPACSRAAHDRCLEVSCAPIPLGSRLTLRVTGPNPSRLNTGTCDKRLQLMTPLGHGPHRPVVSTLNRTLPTLVRMLQRLPFARLPPSAS